MSVYSLPFVLESLGALLQGSRSQSLALQSRLPDRDCTWSLSPPIADQDAEVSTIRMPSGHGVGRLLWPEPSAVLFFQGKRFPNPIRGQIMHPGWSGDK